MSERSAVTSPDRFGSRNTDCHAPHLLQAQHEIKRRERDFERLQGRLRDLLTEKSREQKVALEAVGRFRDTARVRAKKSDEAMYQVRPEKFLRSRGTCIAPCQALSGNLGLS